MKKFKKIFAGFMAMVSLFSIMSLNPAIADNSSGHDISDYDIVDKGTIQIRKGGYKNIPESYDSLNINIEDESIVCISDTNYIGGNYNFEGLKNGTTKISFIPFGSTKLYVYDIEVSDEFSNELELPQAINLGLYETSTLNLADPYDDGWYNVINRTSIYNERAEWTTDNEFVVTVENGKLTAKSAGTALVTAELNGFVYKCDVTVSYLNGDVNKNGVVDLYDVISISEYMMHLTEFDETELALSDYNEDGVTDLYDAIEIAKTLI